MEVRFIKKSDVKYNLSDFEVIFVVLFIMLVALYSCRKIAVDRTEARTNAISEKFRDLLTSSRYGWVVCIHDNRGVSYIYYMQFAADGRVRMKTNYKSPMLHMQESSYTIKLLQSPTLSFDTYNYIHTLSNPDLPYSGYRLDFEYVFTQDLVHSLDIISSGALINRFTLHGILYDSKITFIRAEATEETSVFEKIAAIEKLIVSLKWGNNNTVNILELKDRSVKYHYTFRQIDEFFKFFSFTSLEQDKKGASMNYYFDLCGEDGGIAMKFHRNQYLMGTFENLDLKAEMENVAFSNFIITMDSTKITFDCRNGSKLTKGYLYSQHIDSLGIPKSATEEDTVRFRSTAAFSYFYTIEKAKMNSWDLEQGGKWNIAFVQGSSDSIYDLQVRKGFGTAYGLRFTIPSIHKEVRKHLYKLQLILRNSLYEFPLFRDETKYTNADSTQYFSAANRQNFVQKVDGSKSQNSFYLLSTNSGYELHNPENSLVLALDF